MAVISAAKMMMRNCIVEERMKRTKMSVELDVEKRMCGEVNSNAIVWRFGGELDIGLGFGLGYSSFFMISAARFVICYLGWEIMTRHILWEIVSYTRACGGGFHTFLVD